ncbi:MAG: hypothetical protein GXP43_00670 [bacterium]|nr:hypothetical protein [bacterium]
MRLNIRLLFLFTFIAIVSFFLVIFFPFSSSLPRIYQQNPAGLRPTCTVSSSAGQYTAVFEWTPDGSNSYVLQIAAPVNYKQAVYDPAKVPSSQSNLQLVNGRARWQTVLSKNPSGITGQIDSYTLGRRRSTASFTCSSGDGIPNPPATPTPVPADDFALPTLPPGQIAVGDLNNNSVTNDRGDVLCAIVKYLSLKGSYHNFPNSNQTYVYNLDKSDDQFNRKDVIKIIVNYLNSSRVSVSNQPCLPIDTPATPAGAAPSPSLSDTGQYPGHGAGVNQSPPLKGVGHCHWSPGLSTDVVWFYQSSTPEVWWSTLNPADDTYNIQPLISYINRTSRAVPSGSKFLVEIYLAGVSQGANPTKKYPQWLINKGAVYVPRGNDGTFVPWDDVFKTELTQFLQAVDLAFKRSWGSNLENKPPAFEGIVTWSGGYYGEMQIWWPRNRQLWERYGSQKLGIQPSDPQFKQKFQELWTRSAVNLAAIYATNIHPKVRLMFQLGSDLYASTFNWKGETTFTDAAAAAEIVNQFPNRFYFKYNGWDTGMPASRHWILYNIKHTNKSLGVGYEVGHGVSKPSWMVDYALGINNPDNDRTAGPVGLPTNFKADFVCIQPSFIDDFGNQLTRLIRSLNP